MNRGNNLANGENIETRQPRLPWYAAVMGLCLFLFHLAVNRQYGFHGDELYFIVCGSRLDWGYVDHPPLIALVARVATDLMGTNLFALRLFPAMILGVNCLLTGWLARRMGAGHFGEFLASLSFICAPLMLRAGAFLNIPCFEVFFWLLAAHLLIPLCRDNDPRWWPAVGAVLGLSLLNKHTTLFLGAGMAMGMLLTQRRRDFATPWPWIAAAITFILFLPNLLWQYHHGWATLEFLRNLNATVMQATPRTEFIAMQVILMNAFGIFVWIAAFRFFFGSPEGRPFRMFGWIFLTVLAVMLLFHAKVYYLAPAYPMLMAGGAAFLERWRLPARSALSAALIAMALFFLPMTNPIGTIEAKEQHISRVLGTVVKNPADLTFDFRFQLGREEQLGVFQRVYAGIPEEDKQQCVILASTYDIASEVNVLGRKMGLPIAVGGGNSYFLWGPQGATGECVIAFGYNGDLLRECFDEVSTVAEATCPWMTSSDPVRPVLLCRKPKAPLDQLWPKLKIYR